MSMGGNHVVRASACGGKQHHRAAILERDGRRSATPLRASGWLRGDGLVENTCRAVAVARSAVVGLADEETSASVGASCFDAEAGPVPDIPQAADRLPCPDAGEAIQQGRTYSRRHRLDTGGESQGDADAACFGVAAGSSWAHDFVLGYARVGRRSTARHECSLARYRPAFGASFCPGPRLHDTLFGHRGCGDGLGQNFDPPRWRSLPQRLRCRPHLSASSVGARLREPGGARLWRPMRSPAGKHSSSPRGGIGAFSEEGTPCLDAGVKPGISAGRHADIVAVASQQGGPLLLRPS